MSASSPAAGDRAVREDSLSVLLTAPGRGAIAVVAVFGPLAECVVDDHFRSASRQSLAACPPDRVLFGVWRHGDGSNGATHSEDVVVSRAGDVIEVHCHGGEAASASILAALAAGGCRVVGHREWLEARGMSPIAVDAELALAQATTLRTAAILADQRAGALERAVDAIHAYFVNGNLDAARNSLRALLAHKRLGLRLTQPWRVAVAGRPNVGKSSLVNALVGYERSIVFDEPGTTRDILAAETAVDGWPVRLTDSAGMRASSCAIEGAGVELARRSAAAADLVLWVLDATTLESLSPAAIDESVQGELAGEELTDAPVLPVVNKIDLRPEAATTAPALDHCVHVSAVTRDGFDALLAAIARRLVPDPPPRRAAVLFTVAQIAALEAVLVAVEEGSIPAALAALRNLRH